MFLRRLAIISTLAFIALPFSLYAQDDDEVLKIDTTLVVINATVTDQNGKPVSGLSKKHFTVFEDGKEQAIDFFQAEETPFAAAVLLDTSGSMEQRLSIARASAIRFLEGLRGEDMAAIYRFNTTVKLVQEFSQNNFVDETFYNLKADGWTAMYDAIYTAAQGLANRPEKRKAIVVLSDGEDTKSGRSADNALKAAIAAGITIYTIDMSAIEDGSPRRMQNLGILKNFAEKSGGRFISTQNGIAMRDAFKNIVEELGTQYTLGYQPANTAKDGKWRAIELRSSRQNLQIRARKGYHAPKK